MRSPAPRWRAGNRAEVIRNETSHSKGGDVVSLVAYLEGVSQGEAARRLARMLGLEIGGRRHG